MVRVKESLIVKFSQYILFGSREGMGEKLNSAHWM
jgi:hypothetical protein